MARIPTDTMGNDVQHFTSEVKKYAENKIKLIILNVGEQLSKAIANSASKIVASVSFGIAFIFLLVALALFVGKILHNLIFGFLVASGPCLFAGLFIYILAPGNIARKMQDKIVEKVMNDIDFSSDSVNNGAELDEHQSANKKIEG